MAEFDERWGGLRARLLAGVALGSALAGCDAPPGDVIAGPVPADDGVTPVDEQPADEPGAQQDPEAPAWDPAEIALEHFGTPTGRHLQAVAVRGAPPGATVTLLFGAAVGETDHDGVVVPLGAARQLATGRVAPDGAADLRFFQPAITEYGDAALAFGVVVDDGALVGVSDVLVVEHRAVQPTVPARELRPGLDLAGIAAGDTFRACVPIDRSAYAVCPAVAELDDWAALEIVAYALDRALPGTQSVVSCVQETAFSEDCCYGVAVWEVSADGPPADACAPFAVDGGGGGGGGDWYDGRPFSVDGDWREAPVRAGAGWADALPIAAPLDPAVRERVVAAWTDAARAEHASVASFARLTLVLMALGAPSELVSRATAAAADEIRHARACFGVASAVGGVTLAGGPLPIDGAVGPVDVRAVLVDAIREGCVAETVAAAQVRCAALAAGPALAPTLHRIADDEAEHAELSWAIVRWLVARDPALAELARRTFDEVAAPAPAAPDPLAAALAPYGVLTEAERRRTAAQVVTAVVRPCAAALLGAGAAQPC